MTSPNDPSARAADLLATLLPSTGSQAPGIGPAQSADATSDPSASGAPPPNPLVDRLIHDLFTGALKPAAPRAPIMPSDPGLPSDLLPAELEGWLSDTATLAGVPSVMITLPFLAGTGAVIGNRLGLQVQPGWTEYPALWIALVALTGTGKTPALMASRQPFDQLHAELHAAWQESEADDPFAPLVTTNAAWPRLQQVLPHTNGLLLHRDELLGFI